MKRKESYNFLIFIYTTLRQEQSQCGLSQSTKVAKLVKPQ